MTLEGRDKSLQDPPKTHNSVNPNPIESANTVSMGGVTEAFYYDQMQAGQIVVPLVNFRHFNPQLGSSDYEGQIQGQQGSFGMPLSFETRRALERATGRKINTPSQGRNRYQ